MGVRRLQTFLEHHCPDAFYVVDIEDVANKHRAQYGQEPIIVVDGLSCIRRLYSDLDWVCGGQHKEFRDHVEHFIRKFKELGIELVFFFDGSTQTRKRLVWVQRRYDQMKDAFATINQIRKGHSVADLSKSFFLLPCGISNVMYSVAKENCKVFRSIKECDEEIAEYAARNRCLAILGQDSDFVIYKQDAIYLSIEKLNLETMTTCCYDRRALARHLRLNEDELPVLASLMGNDVIESDQLKRFHFKVTGRVHNQPYARVIVHKLAAFIRDWPRRGELSHYLPELSREVFGTRRHASLLQESISSYNISSSPEAPGVTHIEDSNWGQILSIAHKDYVTVSSSSSLYSILRGLPYEMSTALENYREIPSSSLVLQHIRQRIYGLTLRENPERSKLPVIVVEEWCMSGPHSLDWSAKVKAVLPPDDFPCLLDMWLLDSEPMRSEKFRAFAWITSPCLQSSDLIKLPVEIIAPACVLSFLYNEVKLLREWEVRVLAALVVDVQAMNSHELSQIEVPIVDVRGVHLAVLFTRALAHVDVANTVCGRPIPSHWVKHVHFFDGKLFQSKYLRAKNATVQIQKGEQRNYELLCSVVLS